VSTKLLRLPTRGALGNGLRVVAGAVLASNGFLAVTTRNCRIELRPERDGSTAVIGRGACARPLGTRVEIGFGPDLPEDKDALNWAQVAIHMAHGTVYSGGSSRGGTTARTSMSFCRRAARRLSGRWSPTLTDAPEGGLARSSPPLDWGGCYARMSGAIRPRGFSRRRATL
jgi:hypothetical protein